ncbi:MAG TPA: SPOR domain-containing protein [Burkholderiales bacterium]|nr:SPOR domain-containing protein [Burkholderiales bacterium]
MKALLVALVLGLASTQPLAQPAAVIEGVQMPAWRERDGKRVPLVPGMELRAGDRIVSGKEARVVVRLAEGSMVRLGEDGTLRFARIEPSREIFRAALEVLQGAFRFTTDVAAKARKREVSVRVDTVTIGVRGTDFWGRSRAELQVVCLIEGAIEVGAQGEQPVPMDQPRQFYRRDKGKTQPVGFVEPKQLRQWALETDIEAGKGALRQGGRFSVALLAAAEQSQANSVRNQLREAGYPAEVASSKEGDKTTYLVRIRHLPSREEAQALANQLKGRFGIREPKVSG